MRKLAVSTFLTLDGVMQAPGGPEEDSSGGFKHGGWSVNYWDETMGQAMDQAMAVPFDLLLGRKTYEIFAAHWPYAGDDDPVAKKLNEATKHVASRTLKTLAWKNSKLIAGDVAFEVAKLKKGNGPELQVHGSGNLIQTLLTTGLIDEFRLWIFPVLLGGGKRLFSAGAVSAGLTLVEAKSFTTGVTINTYRPSGPIRIGSFMHKDPSPEEVDRQRKVAREG
jgi:dihydrofolate reductase